MEKVIEAIYEDGVFKPLKKINLPKGTKVKLKILKNSKELANTIKNLSKEYTHVKEDPLKNFLKQRR